MFCLYTYVCVRAVYSCCSPAQQCLLVQSLSSLLSSEGTALFFAPSEYCTLLKLLFESLGEVTIGIEIGERRHREKEEERAGEMMARDVSLLALEEELEREDEERGAALNDKKETMMRRRDQADPCVAGLRAMREVSLRLKQTGLWEAVSSTLQQVGHALAYTHYTIYICLCYLLYHLCAHATEICLSYVLYTYIYIYIYIYIYMFMCVYMTICIGSPRSPRLISLTHSPLRCPQGLCSDLRAGLALSSSVAGAAAGGGREEELRCTLAAVTGAVMALGRTDSGDDGDLFWRYVFEWVDIYIYIY